MKNIKSYMVNSFLGAILAGIAAIMIGGLIWRTLVKKIQIKSKSSSSWLVRVIEGVKFPGYILILLFSIYLTLLLFPDFQAKPLWIVGVKLLLSFLGVIFLGEALFASFIDYYLLEVRKTAIPTIFKQLLKTIIYLIVGLSFLSTTYKIDITPLLTTSAVFTMVIGLALQDVLGNLFAGLSVHVSPPFKIGDWITIGGFFGKVIESNWRATTIRTPSRELIVIPNNDCSKKDITNHSVIEGALMREFEIGLSYDTSPEVARKNLLEACKQVKEILSYPKPEVYMFSFNDFSISYKIRYWIRDDASQARTRDQLASRIWYRLKREGIVIPFPIRNIYIHPEKDLTDLIINRRLAILAEIDFLKVLDRNNQVFIAQNLKEAWYEEGEAIIRKGETGTDFFIIEKGQVSVFRDESTSSRTAVLSEGDFFGEMSLLTGEPRSASVFADVETKVLILQQKVIRKILKENPSIAKLLSETLSARKADYTAKAEEESLEKVDETSSKDKTEEIGMKSSVIFERIRKLFRLR